METWPDVGTTRPAMTPRKVDFPAPFFAYQRIDRPDFRGDADALQGECGTEALLDLARVDSERTAR